MGVIAYYEADQLSLKLYDPFGTIAQEWRITGTYRYSFNGKESDSEWDGGGAMFDYGFRIYDPRLGRFLSVDPLTEGYPWYTPYQFAGNMPIAAIDIDGAEDKIVSDIVDNFDHFWGILKKRIVSDLNQPVKNNAYVKSTFSKSNLKNFQQGTRLIISHLIKDGHLILDGFGMIPVIGAPADVLNGVWYAWEGNQKDAALSFAGAVPGIGEALQAGKLLTLATKSTALGGVVLLGMQKVNGIIEFGKRAELRGVLGITDKLMEAHHIVPWKFRDNPLVQKAAEAGFHMNSGVNGVALKKYSKKVAETADGMHANHPEYDTFVKGKIADFLKENKNYTADQAKHFLESDLIPTLTKHIKDAEAAGQRINEYFKTLKP